MKTTRLKKLQISFFKSKEQMQSSNVTLEDALIQFKDGFYKEPILKLRKYYKQNETGFYDKYKGKLPAFCFNALFNSNRKKENVSIYNRLMLLDIDKIQNEVINDLKQNISLDPYTLAVWLSPSGNGLKVLIKTNSDINSHKDYFKSIQSYYKTNFVLIDKACSDLTRLCYVSYDKGLYINWDSKTFNLVCESKDIEDEIELNTDDVGVIEKTILEITHFLKTESKSITSTHKDWLYTAYAIQSVLPNNNGKDLYLQLCRLDNEKHDEIKSIEKWDYCLNIKNDVDEKITIRTLFYNAKNLGYEFQLNKETFWNVTFKYEKNGEKKEILNINQNRFNKFLEQNGFYRIKISENKILVRNIKNILSEVDDVDIKDFVMNYVNKLPYNLSEQITSEHLINKIIASNYILFNKQRFDFLPTKEVSFLKDTLSCSYFYFRNACVEVTESSIKILNYEKLKTCIWQKQIIDRDIDILGSDEILNDCYYFKFIENLCAKDQDRIVSMMTIIGYLLNTYNDPTNVKCVILLDEDFDNDASNGGNGKTLFASTLGKWRNMEIIDGKTFTPNKNFAFQRIGYDTNLILIDDLRENFHFDLMYPILTTGITIERKNKDEYFIRTKDGGKFIITSNYCVKGKGGNSDDRRKIEILISPYYCGKNLAEDLGKRLFDDWDKNDWNLFDNFGILCTQLFLGNGLSETENESLDDFKLFNETSQYFVNYINVYIRYDKEYEVTELLTNFKRNYPDKYTFLSQREFNGWLKRYVAIKKIKTKAIKRGNDSPIESRNGKQYIMFLS